MSKELAVIKHVDGTALETYRDRDEVRELAERLLSLHPAASEVGQSGMFAVAQLALMIGASPLPGVNEISVWVKEKDGKKIVQFQLGINYYRRKAAENGGVLWKFQPRQMRDDERATYGISPGQLAAICHGVRAIDMEKYITLGFTPNQIWDMVGASGVSTAGVNEAKHGRPPIWTAFKRAEVDLYRRLFPTMMSQAATATAKADAQLIDDLGPDWNELPEDEDEVIIDIETGEIIEPDEDESSEESSQFYQDDDDYAAQHEETIEYPGETIDEQVADFQPEKNGNGKQDWTAFIQACGVHQYYQNGKGKPVAKHIVGAANLLGIDAENVGQDFDGFVSWMLEYAKLRSAGVEQDEAVKQVLNPPLFEEGE